MAQVTDVTVPDVGDFEDIPVIEILVAVGDTVAVEDPLVTLESEKATMDVPSPVPGVVSEIVVSVGDNVSEGTLLLKVEESDDDSDSDDADSSDDSGSDGDDASATSPSPSAPARSSVAGPGAAAGDSDDAPASDPADDGESSSEAAEGSGSGPSADGGAGGGSGSSAGDPSAGGGAGGSGSGAAVYASPMVRRRARELGVDLGTVSGSGRGGRINAADLRAAVDAASSASSAGAGAGGGGDVDSILGFPLAAWPRPDFSKQGETERVELTRIQKLSASNLHRNWVAIPHVTHHDEADITELEAFRKTVNAEQAKLDDGAKVTMVALLLKACVASLRAFPAFNSSLDGDHLILKRYYHLGFAADTPNGLLVPVIRDADQKGIVDLARELTEFSSKARAGKLGPREMSGSTFTISSLGGIGGTAFTPIVNAPEVAILGVTRAAIKPVWDGEAFAPRLMVPLSLSYDHRVIDGAAAARFVAHLSQTLTDLRRVLL